MYRREIYHNGLNKYHVIKAKSERALDMRQALQMAAWDEMWRKKQEKHEEFSRTQSLREKAVSWTKRVRSEIERLENLLKDSLNQDNPSRARAKPKAPRFHEPQPALPELQALLLLPAYAGREHPRQSGFFGKLLGLDEESVAVKEIRWTRHECEAKNADITKHNEALQADYRRQLREWEARRRAFRKKRRAALAADRSHKGKDHHGKSMSLVERSELALARSVYPTNFPKQFQLGHNPRTKVLIVDYQLPPPGSIPNLKRVRHVPSENRLQEVYLSIPDFNKLYGNVLYQVALRTLHEVYQTDERKVIFSIVFNGRVEFTDKATGKPSEVCVLSLQADRDRFLRVDLAHVDPKLCFEKLGGVSRIPLTSLIPVQPLLSVVRSGAKRVVSDSTVTPLPTVDESTNLATLGWDKLCGIYKPILQKDFMEAGGNVIVSHPETDGSVDAVAIDPDPLRGGKILIRAVPSPKPVGATPVRQFYEKVLAAWPARGVMLASHGFDALAFEFTRGKPLTLLHMGCLQTILKKHGYTVEFDMLAAGPLPADEMCGPTCVLGSNSLPQTTP